MKKILLFALLSSGVQLLHAQAGALNPSFGNSGKVVTSFGGSAKSYASELQSDGKIILAGNSSNGSNNDFAIARYNSDGSLDAAFGTGGKVVTDFGNEDNLASVVIQSDGKIVAAGHVNNGNDFDFGVVRYNTDGTPDSSFGTAGKVVLPITPGNDYVAGVHILSNGKIVVTGTKTWSGYDYVLARFNANGTTDNGFGNNGIVTADIYATDVAQASVLQPDEKIVIGGYTYQGGNQWEIARFNSDGTLDANFGNNNTDGTFQHGGGSVVGGMGGVIYKLALQTDGKIVAVGSGGNSFDLIRYNADGSFDHSFNGNGRISNIISGGPAAATSVAIQTNGKILAGGYTTVNSSEDFTLMRYNTDGTPDTNFGSGGTVTTDFSGGQDEGYSLLLNANNIYLSGFSNNGTSSFAIADYIMTAYTLPVTLIDFTGSKAGTQVLLNWHTSFEAQAKAFDIERSDNGTAFEKIGTTTASTFSSSLKAYHFADGKPLQGIAFYRLKLIDQDESFQYSKIIAIREEGKTLTLNLFPNPATNQLQVQLVTKPGKVAVEIQDMAGRALQTQTFQSSGTSLSTSFVIENLKSGMYNLVVKTESGIQNGKFIKQ